MIWGENGAAAIPASGAMALNQPFQPVLKPSASTLSAMSGAKRPIDTPTQKAVESTNARSISDDIRRFAAIRDIVSLGI